MSKTNITILHTRYKIQNRNLIGTFEVDEAGKMTFYKSPESNQVKDYHFELSDPAVVKGVAKLLGQAAKVAEQTQKKPTKKESKK